ncbi:MAG TPA: hypothetical protein VG758_21130 [Hyphomicrobiaceae bacterium]|jgi:hypothetical protein|nr:hypothetical protein [Hyphomicrobiaceae bacterium]
MADQSYTTADLVKCAEREVAYRRRVYPRLVADERMPRERADREIAMMEAIAEKLKDQQRLL